MLDAVPAALLWAVAVWRAPSARQSPAKRSLWIAFVALAVAMTVRPVAIASSLDQALPLNNVSFLIKHLGGIAAAAAVVTFVHQMSEEKTGGLRTKRLPITVAFAAGLSMVVLFFATPQPFEASDLLIEYADDWRMALYGVIWPGYLGAALFTGTRLCWQWGRHRGTGLLGRGLRYIGVGTAVGMVYAAHRTVSILLRHFGHQPISHPLNEKISTALLFSSVVLIVIGSTLPALRRLRQWWQDYRNLIALYPLWFSLTEAVPAVRLDPPRGRRQERFVLSDAHSRLYRRTIEVRDAILTLGDHASPALRDRARAHVVASGLMGAQADVAAEACWLRAARASRLRHDTASGEPLPPTSGGRDLASEIQALRQLSAAYHAPLADTFAAQYDSPVRPEPPA
ncbi:MAB_1171c family putative transporter [Streptomyces aidingensis]|uniref:DUF6545 domain-containing protein n=1 Tax=Streptomyces aidingensis TaxID=910347 RepID=A0A1I1KDH1_9ACTN|nr:MAB_1171c family putative transporter [Streptomyces aidingensis]SFC59024.1 hypothetical protein SAMN05421773_104196 [Streptomyces aidingensis]